MAPKLGGSSGGGGLGGPLPRPPAPSGVGLPSVVSGVPPRGILVPWGLPGGLGRGAPSPRVQRPLLGGRGAAVSLVCLRPLLGLRGGGGCEG